MRSAVRLMCVGALVEAAAVVTMALTEPSLRAAIARHPGIDAPQWQAMASTLTVKEVCGGLAVGLWLFLAWAIGHRRDVARFAFGSFFALITLTMVISLAQGGVSYAPADMIVGAATWLTALITVILLATRRSSAYYRQVGGPQAAHAAG